jgi:hypothetical protein
MEQMGIDDHFSHADVKRRKLARPDTQPGKIQALDLTSEEPGRWAESPLSLRAIPGRNMPGDPCFSARENRERAFDGRHR